MNRTCDCGAKIPVSEGRGRPATYCRPACRQAAYRRRKGAPAAPLRSDIPPALTSRPHWVRWGLRERGGKLTKVPLTVDGHLASVTDPSTWTDYATACSARVGDGIGFVLDGDGIGCIDLDDAINPDGRLSPEAARIVAEHPDALLVEVSPSGRGLHIWDRMPSRPGRRFVSRGQKVEIYSRARYITVTGKLLSTHDE